ncbi:hypothetical protein TNCV_2494331 [Trichonephila clavipes]|uniref:Cytochrome P450 n=1 Tax=Trichonephila clavipes TaxID=2585209 RepID=A0A8X6S2A5_TRICX|nr:hypothetical protein TNCV_2494331 [Trichonephila clavipes]
MHAKAALVIVSFVTVVIYFAVYDKSGNSPPGPIGLPVVGYFPFLTSKPYIVLQELAKLYGPIFRLIVVPERCRRREELLGIILLLYPVLTDCLSTVNFITPKELFCFSRPTA